MSDTIMIDETTVKQILLGDTSYLLVRDDEECLEVKYSANNVEQLIKLAERGNVNIDNIVQDIADKRV